MLTKRTPSGNILKLAVKAFSVVDVESFVMLMLRQKASKSKHAHANLTKPFLIK